MHKLKISRHHAGEQESKGKITNFQVRRYTIEWS